MNKKLMIRRAIVQTLYTYYCPQNLNTILCADKIIMLEADSAQLLAEWNQLKEAGYLIDVPGYPDYCRLSDALRAKFEAGKTLNDDPVFYGPGAIR